LKIRNFRIFSGCVVYLDVCGLQISEYIWFGDRGVKCQYSNDEKGMNDVEIISEKITNINGKTMKL
jgi:hypothetical protein